MGVVDRVRREGEDSRKDVCRDPALMSLVAGETLDLYNGKGRRASVVILSSFMAPA